MNPTQVLICIILAMVATILSIRIVPRQKRSLWFEVVLWIATLLVAFLGSVLGIAAASGLAALQGLTSITWLGTPLVPAALGAAGGALILNAPLSLLSRFDASPDEVETDSDRTTEVEPVERE